MALPQEDCSFSFLFLLFLSVFIIKKKKNSKVKEKERQTRLNEEQGKSNVSIARLAKLVRPEVKILSVALVALFINSLAQVIISSHSFFLFLEIYQ